MLFRQSRIAEQLQPETNTGSLDGSNAESEYGGHEELQDGLMRPVDGDLNHNVRSWPQADEDGEGSKLQSGQFILPVCFAQVIPSLGPIVAVPGSRHCHACINMMAPCAKVS